MTREELIRRVAERREIVARLKTDSFDTISRKNYPKKIFHVTQIFKGDCEAVTYDNEHKYTCYIPYYDLITNKTDTVVIPARIGKNELT